MRRRAFLPFLFAVPAVPALAASGVASERKAEVPYAQPLFPYNPELFWDHQTDATVVALVVTRAGRGTRALNAARMAVGSIQRDGVLVGIEASLDHAADLVDMDAYGPLARDGVRVVLFRDGQAFGMVEEGDSPGAWRDALVAAFG